MIPRETLDRVFATAKIEEVVGDYVTLKRRGANLIGLCPFHDEKTGSFTVSPSKGIYKCFGCGAAGHAVNFVMQIDQCSFVEAVKKIANKYHIEIQERELTAEEQQRQDDRESMFVVNDFCNRWFQSQLWDTPEGQAIGLAYFHERGLRDDIIRKFQLGYSPEKGSPLAQALKTQGFDEKFIINDPASGENKSIGTGVCGKSADGRIYDRFRDRVMFPIQAQNGKIVAFAGRIMRKKENVGKYVNSPGSLIYSKTNELYGLFLAKNAIKKHDRCFLVEGQMDVISMHQSGIENVVASGGTALTEQHVRLIKNYTNNITILYDGDAAGIHAAERGVDMFLKEGFNIKVVVLPDGEDPDSYAQHHNASDFIAYIEEHQTDFIRFKIARMKEETGNDPEQRAKLITEIAENLSLIPDNITRQVYVQDAAGKLQINEQLLSREVARKRQEYIQGIIKERENKERIAALAAASAAQTEQGGQAGQQGGQQSEQANGQQGVQPTPPTQPRVLSKKENKLTENYRNLLQLIVRYGERPLYAQADGTFIQTGEYILSQLSADSISAPNALFQKIADEYTAHCHDENFVAENYYKFHPDNEISTLAIKLIADQYQLSRIYAKQSISENVVQEVEETDDDADRLQELVTRMLLEIKLTIVEQRIDEVEQQMKVVGDWEQQKALIAASAQLLDVRNALCKQLGNRVIL